MEAKKRYSILSLATPQNVQEEQEKFMSSQTYNPQFRYNWSHEMVQYVKDTKPHYYHFIEAMVSQDYSNLRELAHINFATQIDKEVLRLAQQITSSVPDIKDPPTISELIKAFEQALGFLGIPYSVELSDKAGFKFRPLHRLQKMYISKHGTFTYMSTDSAIKHELTHVIRYVNTRENNIPYAKGYLPTEEGLASYVQDYWGHQGNLSLFQHAAQYEAMCVGEAGTFRDIYDYFRSIGLSSEQSWVKTVRQKYGYKDTSQPGTFVKPAMYFYHARRIASLTKNEIWRLFNGKISIDDLTLFPDYSGLISLEKLQKFYATKW
ncbi:MAG: hypothetical protein ACOCXQ_03380 [Patescibacteria group bacterium]